VPLAEPDRNQGLANRNDHDQPVPLDGVRWPHPPATQAAQERPEQADRERAHPEQRPEPALYEPRNDNEPSTGQSRGRNPHDRRQQISVVARAERVQREVHHVHDQKPNPKHHTVTAERIRNS
jgi:hypothetical protein